MKERNHLPLYGIGPILCFPTAVVTAVGIILSNVEIIPGKINNRIIQIVMLVVGILLIIEGILLFIGADYVKGLRKSIKNNRLKTDGSYLFVRNPCYVFFLLADTGTILIAHNVILLVLPVVFWLEMTVVLINTEEKWLKELYGEEYLFYCRRVNRLIPWIPKRSAMYGDRELYVDKFTDKAFWVYEPDVVGPLHITFDGKKIYNLWTDYPHNFTKEEKEIFDKENPYWRDFLEPDVNELRPWEI